MSEPTEKQTPRTDAAERDWSITETGYSDGRKGLVEASFARQLETELAAAEAQAAAMRETLTRSRETFLWLLDRHGAQSAKLRAEEIYATLESTNAMRAERDRLRAENESLRESLSPTTIENTKPQ